jgi:hypothetical protein
MIRDTAQVENAIIDTDELENYFHILTTQVGTIPPHSESGLSIGVEVFTLSEGLGISPSSLQALWRHSVRTGYLAALIAIHQQVERSLVWQSFVGGLLHDIGMLIYLVHQPQVFMAVVDLAQCRGQELGAIEKNLLGATHAESGGKFLARWGVAQELLDIVTFHDQPFQAPHSGFCPLTAVYIANVLEGGGIAQDGDGVVGWEGEAYLLRLGLWDDLPCWQKWVREISTLSR